MIEVIIDFDKYFIKPIGEKDAWKLCDFIVSNSDRLKRYFPKTLEQNLNPDLSKYFVTKKIRQYYAKEEFLFKLKEKQSRTIVGLIYIKDLDWNKKQGEIAYCIGYQFEGMGWTTQSVKALSKYAFDTLGLKTLHIIAHQSNLGSTAVAKKCGYIWKRILKGEHTPPNEIALDMELYELQA